jgi:hypothetical protein
MITFHLCYAGIDSLKVVLSSRQQLGSPTVTINYYHYLEINRVSSTFVLGGKGAVNLL